jgi:hypothetical protein
VALFATTDGKTLGPSSITLGTIASQAASNVTITGGSIAGAVITSGVGGSISGVPINGSTIGAVTASTGRFTSVVSTGNISASGTITATGTIGASNFSGTSSGSNTGDQTNIDGNAATATALANARTIGGISFNGTANVTSFPVPGPIGVTTPAAGNFTSIGVTTQGTGAFTTLSSTGKITSGGNIQVVAAGDLTWGGNYGAGIPVINGTNGVGLTFYPNGSTSGAVAVLNASGLAVTGALSVNNTSITTSSTVSSFLTPNLVNANRSALFVGRSFSANDAAYIGYTPQSTSSLSQLNLGFFGADNLVNITAAGNVGIGTASPTVRLEVVSTSTDGDVTALRLFNNRQASAATKVSLQFYADNDQVLLTAGRDGAGTSGTFNILTRKSGTQTSSLFINETGNVGIGETNPAVRLQVNGIIRAATAADAGVLSLGESSGGTTVNVGLWRGLSNSLSGGNVLNLGGYAGIQFSTGAAAIGSQTSRMFLDTSGNLGVGTGSPGSKITSAVSSGGGIYALEATVDGTAYFQVRNNGVTYTQGGTVSAISTRDVKKNIVESPYSFESLLGLQLRQFQYRDPLIEGRKRLGMIVDEIEGILPEAMNYDDEGKADSIAYSDVALTVAITTMHKLKEINDVLLAQVAELSQRLAVLESK